ncbi:hypothetical protein [Butyrivibrio sp. JL13D10]|uniref:hypothetical protein n=1 Tax=Butyrivibrio sp. JL13D10 TaxID=3236815 RepID=UPI0038B64DCA
MKKNIITITIISALLLTASCRASNENIEKATSVRDSLTQQKELAEDTNGKLTGTSYEDELSELQTQYNLYTGTDFNKLNDKEIQEIIPDMDELSASYTALLDEMNKELSSEDAATLEASKNIEIVCYIANNSGLELSSIILRDNSLGTDSPSFLAEGQTLPSGRILAGVTFPVNTDSASRSIIVTDTQGNEHEYPITIDDPTAVSENGISITLSAPENGAEVGSY